MTQNLTTLTAKWLYIKGTSNITSPVCFPGATCTKWSTSGLFSSFIIQPQERIMFEVCAVRRSG